MSSPFVPCVSCARHVRSSDAACPFCAAPIAASAASVATPERQLRVNRSTLFALGASLALAACDNGGSMPLYGAPADDSSVSGDAAMNDDGGLIDDGGIVAMYGAPSDDANVSSDATPGPEDDGGTAPLYGAVPPDDGG